MTDAVREYAIRELGSTPFDVVVAADDPTRAIVMAANRRDVNLIVMGTHGRRGWQRFIGGSLAESVLHRTDRPVLAVPQQGDLPAISRILCPVNFSEASRLGVKAACSMSRVFASELHMLHVVEEGTQSNFSEVRETVREWITPLVHAACHFDQVISRAAVASDHILEHARGLDAKLLVMGASHVRGTNARASLGTTVEKVLRSSHLPVLSVIHPLSMAQHAAA